jgi:arylsulfatase A-like enzyme
MVTADAKGMHALRMGVWKYIDNTPPEGFPESRLNQFRNEVPRLYNLADDPGEEKNVIDAHPEIAENMLAELNRIREASSTR